MHVRQDAPSTGRLQGARVRRKRPLTLRTARRYHQTDECEHCSRPFDLRTRTTSEDAAQRPVVRRPDFPVAA